MFNNSGIELVTSWSLFTFQITKWLELKKFSVLIFWKTILFFLISEKCPENEMPTKCGNCRATCSATVVDPNCVCIPGCMCVSNYLRNSYGVCVPETECGNVWLRNYFFPFILYILFKHEFHDIFSDAPCENDYGKIYDPCGAVCQKTCENMNDPNYSCTIPTDCTNLGACRCFEGLVLNRGGQCVRPEDCRQFI